MNTQHYINNSRPENLIHAIYGNPRIKTTFSMSKRLFFRKIHEITFRGLLLKLIMFIAGLQL